MAGRYCLRVTTENDMSESETNYFGPEKSTFTQKVDLTKEGQRLASDGGGSYCMKYGLVYQHTSDPKKAIVIHWGDIVLAAIEGAKVNPEIRADILKAIGVEVERSALVEAINTGIKGYGGERCGLWEAKRILAGGVNWKQKHGKGWIPESTSKGGS